MSSTDKFFTSIISFNPQKPVEARNTIQPTSQVQKPPARGQG